MKKIIMLFFIINCLAFSIPNFSNLGWGFTADAVKGFYPEAESEITTINDVTKYNYYPKDTDIEKITFLFVHAQLYKIISVFDLTKVHTTDVKDIFEDYSNKWGKSNPTPFEENYESFTIKGNEHTWVVDSTYISFIGEDYFDTQNNLTNSKLITEYGLIDPIKINNK